MTRQQVPNYELAETARHNLVTNGGFEVWQRGNGPFTGNTGGVIHADRWYIQTTGTAAGTATRETAIVDGFSGSAVSINVTATTAASSDTANSAFLETMNMSEAAASIAGRIATTQFRVYTTTAGAVVTPAWYVGGSGWVQGTPVTLAASTWTSVSQTGTVPASGAIWSIGLVFHTVAVYKVDNVTAVPGPVPARYAPMHPAEELARCLRYYEKWGTGAFEVWASGQSSTATAAQFPIRYVTPKAVTATVTLSGPASDHRILNGAGGGVAATAMSAANPSANGCSINATTAGSLAVGQAVLLYTPGNTYFTVEANP
jgi:hypothetical protein